MLKLSISNSIFNAISANLLKGAAAVQHMELTHKELKQALREDLAEKATLLEKDVDTYIKEDKESRTQRFTRMIEEMNTGSIPSIENNKIRITSTEDEVTLELKTEFLSDAIDVAGNIFVDGLKSSAETFLHYRRVKGMVKSFAAKWKDGSEPTETMTSKVVPESEVPAEARNLVKEAVVNLEVSSDYGTKYTADNGVSLQVGLICNNITLDEETVVQVHYLTAVAKDGKTYTITPCTVEHVLKAPEVTHELQTEVALPYSVMKSIRKAYPTLVKHFAAQQESK